MLLDMAKYDNTISLGSIIATIGFIAACIRIVFKIGEEYAKIEIRIGLVESKIENRIAVIEGKINILYAWWEKKVDEVTSIRAEQFFQGDKKHIDGD